MRRNRQKVAGRETRAVIPVLASWLIATMMSVGPVLGTQAPTRAGSEGWQRHTRTVEEAGDTAVDADGAREETFFAEALLRAFEGESTVEAGTMRTHIREAAEAVVREELYGPGDEELRDTAPQSRPGSTRRAIEWIAVVWVVLAVWLLLGAES